MQEVSGPAGRRPAQHQFAGVDLRRPKGYAAPPQPSAAAAVSQTAAEEEGDPCPRCESRDTKFCYYNNYNTAQPRHFCKGCRRYWTKGGTLRNVPVGGGTRKKPSSSSSSPSSYAAAAKPKRPYKKKRRVAPPEPSSVPAPAPVASPAAADPAKAPPAATTDSAKPTMTDAVSEITTELVYPAAEDDSLAHLLQPPDAVALELDLSDFPSSCKSALLEPDSFVWPASSFDLSTCWSTAGGFVDTDPALFLNIP